ncbi:metabotropic glutamate receptor 7-like [Physella acuta]|uniref:metabotropic glutamate receptor 7-like n=1 Tax=Physella acuta TaxID=109671 RepID=UPI0027DC0513|nr:metabotropic glutamate receptor 7-like [Physella acuta]
MMFANEDNSRRVVRAISDLNKTESVYLLASDSWGAKVHPVYRQEPEAEGTVTILPTRRPIEGFDNYFLNLTLNNTRNPWFKEFWADIFNCSIGNYQRGARPCTGEERLDKWRHYKQEGLVQFVIDSVFALAHAVHDMMAAQCPGEFPRCPVLKQLHGPTFLQYIRNVSFTGISGAEIQFNKNGDSLGRYDIFQFQRVKDEFKYIKVGEWTDTLILNKSMMRWKNGSQDVPTSFCSEPCKFGHAKLISSDCCWNCVPCKENEYMPDEGECRACPPESRPTASRTGCETLPVVTLVPASLWFVLPVAFSIAGVVCTVFVFGVFLTYNKTPLIMASGRELCYILLFGIALSYCTSVAMLARPTPLTCAIRRLGLGVSLCFVYAAILTKTNRIFRIFSVGIKAMVKRPSYTSPKSQIFICSALVSVQIVGAFTWIGFEKPNVVLIPHQKDTLVLKCRASQIATIVSLFYNIFLIILCTVYAFKTRKIPQNFNEAKYIAFTMYSTCIVWCAFVPIYFGANHDFKIEVTSLCMCVNISATVALFCLFAPKVYIVLLQPHKNVRQTSTAATSTKVPRAFYDPPTASTGGVCPPYHYNDLNGGVYCGDIPTQPALPPPMRERKKNNTHVVLASPTSNVTMTTVAAHRHHGEDAEDGETEEMVGHTDEMVGHKTLDEQLRERIHFPKLSYSVNDYDDVSDSSDECSPVKIPNDVT